MRLRQLTAFTAVFALLACGGDGGVTVPNNMTGSVRGTVTDNQNANVVDASVALTATGRAPRTARTVADGSYTFTNVPIGVYTLTVTPPVGFSVGAGGGASSVTVVAGQQASVAAIVLNRNAGGVPPNFVDVSMSNTQFFPPDIELAVGGRVRFTNNDAVAHNARAPGRFQTADLNPGASQEVTLATAGTVDYTCTIHPGMSGTIIVR